ncbi:MAG: hypothetical protein R6V08_04785 [Desulfuromonadales bacterium]
MIRILHTADLLLDYSFAGNDELAALRRGDQLRTFEKLINLAIKNEVDLMVFAGNLFATPRPEPELIESVCNGLQRLVDRQIVPVVLPGGLDGIPTPDNIYRLTSIPGLLLSDVKSLRQPISLDVKSTMVHLYGFAWGSDGDPSGLSSMTRLDKPGIHIGILQAGADGDQSDYFCELPAVDLRMLRSWGLDYVALGNCRNWREFADEDDVQGVFPGTPEAVSFEETGLRHCALVTLDGETTKLEKIPANSRTLEKAEIDISGIETTASIAEAIGEHAHPETVFRAVLKGEPSVLPDLETLHISLAERFARLEIDDRSVLLEGRFPAILRQRGQPFARLLEEAEHLRSQATESKDLLLLDEAFRTALEKLENAEEGRS